MTVPTSVFIGIDMGATHTRICMMNPQSEVLLTDKSKTADIIGNDFLQGIKAFCFSFCQSYLVKKIVIGLPAAISRNRQKVLSVPNLFISQAELDQLVPYLSTQFGCNVLLERDVNLQMTYDVMHFNLKEKLVLGLYVGTGMGFSIWNEGEIFLGAHGVAGELGHIPYGDDDLRCGCGNYGCLETNCSGIALKRWHDSSIKGYPIDEIFSQAEKDGFIHRYLIRIAKAVSTCINLFDPDVVILGGGVMDMKDFPYALLERYCMSYVRKPLPYNKLKLLKASSSSFNGAIGAALLANQRN
ncbi:allose kinase [Chelonobacter oris]|uniref:allose kinase n=1 Tax=Chelonobacter oris TaxID=505317 RepID=UPI0024498076|nr:allose kinase [Chelonobacter oris]MDH3000630.1 allose kinase [Chelonobacter oris]